MSQPNNPDQEPFRPASYDLTSSLNPGGGQGQPGEYPPPPPAAYPGYPGYPGQAPVPPPPPAPTPGMPQWPAGAHPAAPTGPAGPPAGGYSGVYYGGPPTAPGTPGGPPVQRKPKTGLWFTLGIIGVVLVAACCGGGLYARSYLTALAKPAKVSAPDRVAGMDRITDNASLKSTADQVEADLKRQTNASSAAAGYWAPSGDRTHLFFALAVAALILQPDKEVTKAFTAMQTSGLSVDDIHTYPAGPQGGTLRCGTAKVQSIPVAVCIWGDNASLGITEFFNRNVRDGAKLTLNVRNDMVSRS